MPGIWLRVPGFEINDGDDRRGFWARPAGNVLVNGERPSSKASISEQLRRIPASVGAADGAPVRQRRRRRCARAVAAGERRSAADGRTAAVPCTWVAGGAGISSIRTGIGYTLQVSKIVQAGGQCGAGPRPSGPPTCVAAPSVRGGPQSAGVLTRYREQYNQPNFNGLQARGKSQMEGFGPQRHAEHKRAIQSER